MKRSWLAFLLIFIVSGCWDQRVVEEMEFILNIGFDAAPNQQIYMYISTPSISGEGSPKATQYATIINAPREGRERMRLGSYGRLDAGKVQQILFGESLAKRGIKEYLDIFSRDPRDPVLTRPVIVKGKAGDLIKASIKWENKGLPGLYLRRLLDNMTQIGSIPDQNVSHFLADYFAPGIDPILPYITFTPTGALTLGTALFHEDRFSGTLNTEESFLLNVLDGNGKVHISPFNAVHRPGESKHTVVIRFIKSQCKTKVVVIHGVPQVRFKLRFNGLIDEWHINELLKTSDEKKIERTVEKQLVQQLTTVWKKLRKAKSDPLGIGDRIRAYHNVYWRSHDWDKIYPTIKAEFQVKVDVQRFGVLQ